MDQKVKKKLTIVVISYDMYETNREISNRIRSSMKWHLIISYKEIQNKYAKAILKSFSCCHCMITFNKKGVKTVL